MGRELDTVTRQDPELLRRLLRAKDRMTAKPHEHWPVRRLAKISGTCEAHFARSFKRAFGVPPHRFLLTLRIERAKALLSTDPGTITEVALACGWTSLGTFTRTFGDVVGQSPSTYRSTARPVPPCYSGMPVCFAKASARPQLEISVSEKRRREALG